MASNPSLPPPKRRFSQDTYGGPLEHPPALPVLLGVGDPDSALCSKPVCTILSKSPPLSRHQFPHWRKEGAGLYAPWLCSPKLSALKYALLAYCVLKGSQGHTAWCLPVELTASRWPKEGRRQHPVGLAPTPGSQDPRSNPKRRSALLLSTQASSPHPWAPWPWGQLGRARGPGPGLDSKPWTTAWPLQTS